ncbi:MAG: hypothetical protein R2725_06455 [Solirubrobacterales bacterium]
MLDFGSYLLGVVQLALVALSSGLSAYLLRRKLLPGWEGAPARLVEVVVTVAILIWIAEILGTFSFLYPGAFTAASVLLALALYLSSAGGAAVGDPRGAEEPRAPSTVGVTAVAGPAGQNAEDKWTLLGMTVAVSVVVGHWALVAKDALDRGIFNFDSLWYHQPFAVGMAQSHSTTGLVHTETVFANWFYPQNSELLHALGMLLTGRDTLSVFLNFGWLGVAFLAAWCIGRPYGRGSLVVVATAIVLACHTLVVREPGAAKNDLMAAALLLAAVAILIEAWSHRAVPLSPSRPRRNHAMVGWPLAAAGLAAGLAAGTKVTVLAMAAALSVAAIALSPAGRRWAAAGWWFGPALLGGGYWYLRNLIATGNPIPEIESLGPISLPHPEHLQGGRPDFTVAHYLTDTGVWSEYFGPGLHNAFGALWPLVVVGAALAALLALLRGRDRVVRWSGGVALFGMTAYLLTPLSAAGAEGEPVAFGINLRFLVPALLLGIALVPLPRWLDRGPRRWWLLAALLAVLVVTDRSDAVARDPARGFAVLLVVLLVLVPAALLVARSRGAATAVLGGGFATLALVVLAIGYPVQRHYLEARFANGGPRTEWIPGMDLDSAYRWARGVEDARIGLSGTSAGFAGYGFYGTDLSNRVVYLGEEGPHGAFNAIPDCEAFRAAVNRADLDYLVTAPFLNFLSPSHPIASPEARWLRGERAVEPLVREGGVTVWEIAGELDPAGCGPANAPQREVPNTPGA